MTSQVGVAPFASKDGSIKSAPYIIEKDGMRTISANTIMDEDAFIDGLWMMVGAKLVAMKISNNITNGG